MNIMRGLIPSAGKGTRLYPYTKAIPKELMPLGDGTVIDQVLDRFKNGGITDITIVISPNKCSIINYLQSGKEKMVDLSYVIQDTQDGLAKAIETSKILNKKETFVVILGDNFFLPEDALNDLIKFHYKKNADATIGVTTVDDPSRHGMIRFDGDKIIDLIEKPIERPPSSYGIAGVYVFEPCIFDAIFQTEQGYNNEYQLTDAIKILVEDGKDVFFRYIPLHIDVGTIDDLIKANKLYYSRIGGENVQKSDSICSGSSI